MTEIAPQAAEDLLTALFTITPEEMVSHGYGQTAENHSLCVAAIQRFIRERLASGGRVFIEPC